MERPPVTPACLAMIAAMPPAAATHWGVLTMLTMIPLAGGVALLLFTRNSARTARYAALGVSLAALAVTLGIWHGFAPNAAGMQFEERHAWIPALNVEYRLGIDGLGLLMLALSAVVTPMAIAASSEIRERASLYFALVLFLEAGLFGTFTALNFFHWFLYWELSLIPAFFLVKLFGGAGRSRAATTFFVYTMVGSVALLLAFLAIYLSTGSFDFLALAEVARNGQLTPALAAHLGTHHLSADRLAALVFAAAFLGLAVKVPVFPFHTWLPDAYTEAASGTTMLLTGVMSKMGVYGFLRILLPLFPQEMRWVLTPLEWLAVGTIVSSALAAFAQRDLKRIFAYSSINHLGYCMLAIFAVARFTGDSAVLATEKAAALDGVLLQMFNHGLTAATLFWFVALVEKRSDGRRGLDEFGGLRAIAPVFCGLMGIAVFSSLGLPGLNGFVGEFLIFKGAFPLVTWASSLAVIGLLMTAVFLLTLMQRIFSGPLNPRWLEFADLTTRERLALAPAIALMFVLGLYPQLVLGVVNGTVMRMVEQVRFTYW
jgi:NADH-quinone oxidoreductase subunit M